MTQVEVLFSLFLVVLVGFVAGRLKLIPKEVVKSFMRYVFYIALPIAVFLDLSTSSKDELSTYPKFILINIGIGIFMYVFLFFILRRMSIPRAIRGNIMYGGNSGNNIFVGLPVLLSVYGEAHFTLGVIYSVFAIAFLDTVAFLLLNIDKNSDKKFSLKKEILDFLKNPVVIATLLGFAALLTGVTTDKINDGITDALTIIAKTTSGVALISLGLYFAYNFKITKLNYALVTTSIKLFLLPLVVYLTVFYIVPLDTAAAQVSVVQAAMPVAVSSLAVAEVYDLDRAQASSTIILSSILFLLTSLLIFLLPHM